MILSTTTIDVFEAFGYQEGIRILAEAGFDALDMNLTRCIYQEEFSEKNYALTCSILKETAEKNGIYFNQAHAPYPPYRFGDAAYNKKIKAALIRSIKIAGLLGARQIVVHPIVCPADVDQKQFNLAFYNSLIPYCRECGVKIALENMWGHAPEDYKRVVPSVCSYGRDLADYFDALDPKYFTVCLDIGHVGLVGQKAEDAILELGGSRLHALHVHDNDGICDEHTIPFQGTVNWNAVMKALTAIHYDGDFTYEIYGKFLKAYSKEPILMVKALELMVATGKTLIAKFKADTVKSPKA